MSVNPERMVEFLYAYGYAKFGDEFWPGMAHKWLSPQQLAQFADVLHEVTGMTAYAVYDEDGECVGTDVYADGPEDAIAELAYSTDEWTAVPQRSCQHDWMLQETTVRTWQIEMDAGEKIIAVFYPGNENSEGEKLVCSLCLEQQPIPDGWEIGI